MSSPRVSALLGSNVFRLTLFTAFAAVSLATMLI